MKVLSSILLAASLMSAGLAYSNAKEGAKAKAKKHKWCCMPHDKTKGKKQCEKTDLPTGPAAACTDPAAKWEMKHHHGKKK